MSKVLEQFVKQYFVKNGIPLVGRKPYCVDFVKMSIYGHERAGCDSKTVSNFNKKYFSDKPPKVRLFSYLLILENKKHCSKCKKILDINMFYISVNQSGGFRGECKQCHKIRSSKWKKKNSGLVNYSTRKRQAAKLNRTPSWADQEAIKFFYECCPAGCHVDHIVPLQGKTVSGLHVETNLQWLPAKENLKKSNKF